MKKVLFFLLLSCIASGALVFSHDGIEQNSTSATIIGRIESDYQNGLIDYSTSLLYKIYFIYDTALLPPRYTAEPAEPLKCATPVVLEIQRNWDQMSAGHRALLAGMGINGAGSILARPSWDPDYTATSAIYPLTVHYENLSQAAYAAEALSYFETSWQKEITEFQFTAPPPDHMGGDDNYDVYVKSYSGALGVTFSENSVGDTWWQDSTSYICIDPNLSGSNFNTTCAHEFNHACQMADDIRENMAFFENTSMWIEDMVFDDSNDYYWYISEFQKNPYRPLDWNGGSLYIYGGCLWPHFLVQHYAANDPQFMSSVWFNCRQGSGPNEPDNFDAIATVMAGYTNDTFDDAYAELANWRYITGTNDDGGHYEEGAAWGTRANVKIWNEHKHASYPAYSPDPLPAAPYKYGTNYAEFSAFDDAAFNVVFNGDPLTRWRVGLITVTETGGTYTCYDMTVSSEGHGTFTVPQATNYARIIMVICNMSEGNYDPDTTPETQNSYSYYAYTGENSSIQAVFTGKGAGPGNDTLLRGFNITGAQIPGFNFEAFDNPDFGARVSCGDVNEDGFDEILTGPGPDASLSPEVRLYRPDGALLSGGSFLAYGIDSFGVNVGAGDVNQDGRDEIITGPGPGAVFGPHVRAWDYNGNAVAPLAGASFMAYGTKKFGANVSSGNIDADPGDEFLTGAGPGVIFGPHVRAFNFDGGVISPDPRVSFMAYNTRKFGVNVSGGDVDGDGYDEILTVPGPGALFGPQVRGWNYDGDSLNAISKINYFAYANRRFGARITAGDMDQDQYDEIITGPGPGSMLGPNVAGWNYDNSQIARINSLNFMAYPSGTKYGADVAAGQFLVSP